MSVPDSLNFQKIGNTNKSTGSLKKKKKKSTGSDTSLAEKHTSFETPSGIHIRGQASWPLILLSCLLIYMQNLEQCLLIRSLVNIC